MKTEFELPRELTIKQAADVLGVSPKTVRAYLAEGSLMARDAAPLKSCRKMLRIPIDAVLAMRNSYVIVKKRDEPTKASAHRVKEYVPKHFKLACYA